MQRLDLVNENLATNRFKTKREPGEHEEVTKLPNIGGSHGTKTDQIKSHRYQGWSGDTSKQNSLLRESDVTGNVSANFSGRRKRGNSKVKRKNTRNVSGNLSKLNSDLSDDNEAMLKSKILGRSRKSTLERSRKSKSHLKNSMETQRRSKLRASNKRSQSLARGTLRNSQVQDAGFAERRSTLPNLAGPIVGPQGGFVFPAMMPPSNTSHKDAKAPPYMVVYGASPYGYFAGMQVPLPLPISKAA